MNSLSPRASKFRHVVFSDELDPVGHALDLTPRPAALPPPESNETAAAAAAAALSRDEESFVTSVMRGAGLDARDYKPGTLVRRMPACLRTLRAKDVGHARRLIERTPALAAVAVNTLVIGVTSFFRDARVFGRLAADILPDLLRRPGVLRVWCAGCSDGAEAYSVAMLLAEMDALGRAQLLGTDCRDDAVRRSSVGAYSTDELRTVPGAWRDKYFGWEKDKWHVRPELRRAAQFRSGDVMRQREPGPFDLVLCRNLAIYLKPEAAGQLWQTLQDSLRPGGVLLLGKAETPTGAGKLSPAGASLFRRNRG